VDSWLVVLIVAVSVAVALAALIAMRRFAPAGGFFTDNDRSAGIFGVLGTAFSVLLAFVIFLVFQSYSDARGAAAEEAVAVGELDRTARLLDPRTRGRLHAELACYARAVVEDEWPAMARRKESNLVADWISSFQTTIDAAPITTEKESVALSHWMDQGAERREGRRGRLAEAESVVPQQVWVVLLLGGLVVVVILSAFADPAEPLPAQGLLTAGVTALVAGSLLLVYVLDRPYGDHAGSIRPGAMRLALSELERSVASNGGATLCDARGVRVR
jgi:hypothetical protein